MKWLNLYIANTCFLTAMWLDCPWLALIGFGNLLAFAVVQGCEVYDFFTKHRP